MTTTDHATASMPAPSPATMAHKAQPPSDPAVEVTGAQALIPRSGDGCRHGLRPPAWRAIPGIRPPMDSNCPPHPRPPRARARGMRRRVSPRPPVALASAWRPRVPRDQPCRRRDAYGLRPDRRITGQVVSGRSARRLPGRPTSAVSRCRSPSTTYLVTDADEIPGHRRGLSTSRAPAALARSSSTSPGRAQSGPSSAGPARISPPRLPPLSSSRTPGQIREAAKLILAAKEAGVLCRWRSHPRPRRPEELRRLPRRPAFPSVTTLMARAPPLTVTSFHLGMPGMHGPSPP